MVRDLMTIVHCFSSRLYGLRNYRRQLRAALERGHAAGAPDQA
jgi:predicted site-specific integrase-resolvase